MVFTRQHFSERKISEINPETDINVCILGRIIDMGEGSIIIDDGTGNSTVLIPQNFELKNLSINNIVRIFGFVVPTPEGFDIRVSVMQDMNSLDIELYSRVIACK